YLAAERSVVAVLSFPRVTLSSRECSRLAAIRRSRSPLHEHFGFGAPNDVAARAGRARQAPAARAERVARARPVDGKVGEGRDAVHGSGGDRACEGAVTCVVAHTERDAGSAAGDRVTASILNSYLHRGSDAGS